MELTTRTVIAVLVVLLLVAGLWTDRRGDESLAAWLMTAGFAAATVWAGLSVLWTYEFGSEGMMSPEIYLSLFTTGVAFTIYYGLRAKDGVGVTGRWE